MGFDHILAGRDRPNDPEIAHLRGLDLARGPGANRRMDHKTFMASLPPEDLARLSQRSDARGLHHLALHLGAICGLGLWIALGGPLWWALIPVQGVLIVFLFTLEHECTHQTPFANTRLNEAVGHLCGFLLLLPFLWFRYFHLAHHRWTNLPGKDPELDSSKPTSCPRCISASNPI